MSASRAAVLLCIACTAAPPPPEEFNTPIPEPPVELVPPIPPPPATAPVRPIVGEIGTAHSLVTLAIPPTGHWVALCQARVDTDGDGTLWVRSDDHGRLSGDDMQPYLFRAAGEGQAIEEFAGSDTSGRHVAFYRGGELVLLDSWAGTEAVLFKLETKPKGVRRRWRVMFSADGSRAIYARRTAKGHEIFVRPTSGGEAVVIPVGPAALWSFEFDRSENFVLFWSSDRDTDGDGEITEPDPKTTLARTHCRGSASSWGFYGWRGDEPVRHIATIAGGEVVDEREPLGILRGEVVARREDRAIVARTPAGDRELVPASCDARLLHVNEHWPALYVACMSEARDAADKNRHAAPLRRYVDGRAEDLGKFVLVEGSEQWDSTSLTVSLGDGKVDSISVRDLDDHHPEPTPTPPHTGENVLVFDSDHVTQRNVATGRRRRLPFKLRGYPDTTEGPLSAHTLDDESGVVVFDRDRGGWLGRVDGVMLGLATTGEVLVAAKPTLGRGDLIQGPLRWVAPR